MAAPRNSKTLAALALWHLCLAVRVLQRMLRLGSNALSDKTLAKADDLLGDFPEASAKSQVAGPSGMAPASGSLLPLGAPAHVPTGDFLTIDIVEIRGRLGSDDNRELKINGQPPLRLERREHAILLILGWLAKCAALPPKAGRKPLPAFLPAKVIVQIILRLTAEGGPLAGLWVSPCELDIYRSVNELRRRLRERGFNPKLIESGQRKTGYRLSTPVSHIILNAAEVPREGFWAELFGVVLGGQGGSGEGGCRGV
jgi:hypothetical protein